MRTGLPGQPSFLSKASVLIVEETARCAERLAERTAALHVAEGAREAVIAFARFAPDMVVMEVTGGDEAAGMLRSMRSMNPGAAFVGLVGDSSEALRQAVLADLDGLVHVPLEPGNLFQTLDRIAANIHSRRNLTAQKRLTELLVHGLPHPALLFDVTDRVVLLANSRAENLGYAAGNVCGPPLLPDKVAEREDVRKSFATYAPAQIGEVEIEGRYYDITLAPASPDTVLLFAADVTRKKRLERQREDVERVVRHDLKTPLNGIIGFSALLIEQDPPREKIKAFAEQIHESSTRMLKMINSSLDISKMEAGTYACRPEFFDLAEVLRSVHQDLERPFRPKMLAMDFRLNGAPLRGTDMEDGWEPVEAWGEARHVESMMGNLLLNAMEAAPDRSTITVAVTTGPDLKIAIHNMGTVPREIRDRFFERYATSGKRGGTGLGTFSAKLICEAHGGDISFTSSEEAGTRVMVKLPGPGPEKGRASEG